MTSKYELEDVLRIQEGLFGIEIREVKEIPCTKPGDNYMSIVNLLEFEGILPGGVLYKGTVFVKRQPDSEERRKLYRTQDAFNNETIMYKDVLPSYNALLPCPRCLYANNDVVYLENLRSAGYSMASRHLGFDLNQATLILKALARIHVASYHALKVKTTKFTSAVDQLKITGFMITTQKEITELSLRRAMRQLHGQEVQEAVLFLQNHLGNFYDCLKSLRTPKDIKVLCHGDFWINNILIREGEDPVKIVDFQSCAVLSPAVDVWSFLYTSVKPSIMETAFPRLVQTYYTSFLEELSVQNVSSDDTLLSKNLMHELQSRELYGYLVGLLFIPALAIPEENFPDLETISQDDFLNDDFMEQFISPDIKERMSHLTKLGSMRGLFKNP